MKQELQKNFKFSVLFAVAMGFVLLCSAANGQANTHSVVGATMNLRNLSAKVSGDSYGCLRDKVSRLGKGRPDENVPFSAESVSFFESGVAALVQWGLQVVFSEDDPCRTPHGIVVGYESCLMYGPYGCLRAA
jgi:hypothetical protein